MDISFLQPYTDEAVALYGLSSETQKAIKSLDKFNIVGLLDGVRDSGQMYGVDIINLSEVLKNKVKVIVAIARPGSCRAIAKRIGTFCVENNIMLFDTYGNDLLAAKIPVFSFESMNFPSILGILEKCMENDVISFDLFDTLIMRKVLYSSDIFFKVDDALKSKSIYIENFSDKRIMAEKSLSLNKVPNLEEIYTALLEKEGMPTENAQEYALLEWQIDYETIIPRNDVINIFENLISMNKKVCIVTDTYYKKSQINDILNKVNLNFDIDVFISCEERICKTQGLFSKVKNKYGKLSYLHIGDDELADIKSSENAGINSIKICSAVELLEYCGNFGLENYFESYNIRLKMGLIVSKLFNSPFLYKGYPEITIADDYSFGYCLIAAIVTDFVLWLKKEINKNNIHNIWFSARDGYLIKKLYEIISDEKTVYFLVSRIAAVRAGVSTDSDFNYVKDMKFSGLESDENNIRYGVNSDFSDKSEIFNKCNKSRYNYMKYIDSLKTDDTDIAFFDFVAKGTSQIFCQRLIKNRMLGFYFLKLPNESEIADDLKIYSYINEENLKSSSIYNDYYILEPILTSPQPTLMDFDDNGLPIFADESRTLDDIGCVMSIQQGIIDFFNDYICLRSLAEECDSSEFSEKILSLIHRIRIDSYIKTMKVEDIFFNRITDISDLL